MKTRFLITMGIFSVLIGTVVPAFAFEPEPVGANIVEYGIFDPNNNNTNLLNVGDKYHIKATFESELDEPMPFTYFVKVVDKNKHFTEIVDEFSISGTFDPGESQSASFSDPVKSKYFDERHHECSGGLEEDMRRIQAGGGGKGASPFSNSHFDERDLVKTPQTYNGENFE